MNDLKNIDVFVRAAEAGSFNKVATALGISPQGVSKMIRGLEQQLGVRLFHRTTRQINLTEDGLRFLEAVKPGLNTVSQAIDLVKRRSDAIEGPVRISAARSARKVLLPVLAEFNAEYPGVTFDLLLEDRATDAVAEKIDVGFRSGALPSGQLIARSLFQIQQFICASPDYLARYGTPENIAALQGHCCSGYRLPDTGRLWPWELLIDGELQRIDVAASFVTNDPEAEVAAVVAGIGIGLLDSINASADIRDGRLVPVLTQHHSDHLAFSLHYAQRHPMPQRVRVFIDFVVSRLLGSTTFRLAPEEYLVPANRH